MLDIWKLSHVDTLFYRRLGQYSGWRIFLYLLTFYLFFSVACTTLFAVRTLPKWQTDAQLTWSALRDQWPEEAEVHLTDNQLTLRGRDQVEIAFPESVAKHYTFPKYLLVINPTGPVGEVGDNADNLTSGNAESSESALLAEPNATASARVAEQAHDPQIPTLFWFDTSSVWVKRAAGDFQPFSFSEVSPIQSESVVINQSFLQSKDEEVKNNLSQAAWSLLPGAFLWYWLFRLAGRIFILTIMTWLAQPILWIFGWFMSYRQAFRMGLFILPIAEEVTLLLTILYPQSSLFSYWLVWLMALLVVGWTNRRPVAIKAE
jgi:hypothetical protein